MGLKYWTPKNRPMTDRETRHNQHEQFHAPAHPVVERDVNELIATLNELDWDFTMEVDLEWPETITPDVFNKQIHVEMDLYREVDDDR